MSRQCTTGSRGTSSLEAVHLGRNPIHASKVARSSEITYEGASVLPGFVHATTYSSVRRGYVYGMSVLCRIELHRAEKEKERASDADSPESFEGRLKGVEKRLDDFAETMRLE